MTKCGKGCMPECEYFTTGGCISSFNCVYKEETGYINSATSGAAGVGDVKDLQAQVNALEMTNIALQAGYDGAEKDRLYWVDKYKEAEHRAEVAERALVMSCANMVKDEKSDVNIECVIRVLYYKYLKQAEKELNEVNNDNKNQ